MVLKNIMGELHLKGIIIRLWYKKNQNRQKKCLEIVIIKIVFIESDIKYFNPISFLKVQTAKKNVIEQFLFFQNHLRNRIRTI